MEYYTQVIKKYAVFDGRARRKEFWMFVLFNALISIALGLLEKGADMGHVLSNLYSLFVLLPCIGVSVRRLHDTDRSGWWILLSLIPIIGWIALIIFYATEGTKGSNKYGANPKEIAPTV